MPASVIPTLAALAFSLGLNVGAQFQATHSLPHPVILDYVYGIAAYNLWSSHLTMAVLTLRYRVTMNGVTKIYPTTQSRGRRTTAGTKTSHTRKDGGHDVGSRGKNAFGFKEILRNYAGSGCEGTGAEGAGSQPNQSHGMDENLGRRLYYSPSLD